MISARRERPPAIEINIEAELRGFSFQLANELAFIIVYGRGRFRPLLPITKETFAKRFSPNNRRMPVGISYSLQDSRQGKSHKFQSNPQNVC
jgi:hypothetical protein